jgi:hypothetical protein
MFGFGVDGNPIRKRPKTKKNHKSKSKRRKKTVAAWEKIFNLDLTSFL